MQLLGLAKTYATANVSEQLTDKKWWDVIYLNDLLCYECECIYDRQG